MSEPGVATDQEEIELVCPSVTLIFHSICYGGTYE